MHPVDGISGFDVEPWLHPFPGGQAQFESRARTGALRDLNIDFAFAPPKVAQLVIHLRGTRAAGRTDQRKCSDDVFIFDHRSMMAAWNTTVDLLDLASHSGGADGECRARKGSMAMDESRPASRLKPDWAFELLEPGTAARPEIASIDIDSVETAWRQIQTHVTALATIGAQLDGVIQKWHAQGFSADQIAVAARLPLNTVKELLENPGIVAFLRESE